MRISIEWNYLVTGSLFKYIKLPSKLRILANSKVAKVFTVAKLFKNFHVALFGCQSSVYFKLQIPDNMLENYINQTDL